MANSELESLTKAIHERWTQTPGSKAARYVGQFFDAHYTADKVWGKVEGNHGTYTVSILIEDGQITSACSCYIGKHGGCHHVNALAITFLKDPGVFEKVETKQREDVRGLDDLKAYLDGITLEDLLKQLKSRGITAKSAAESMGMSPQKLGAIKSSELRNRHFSELGATKLACLWILEHFGSK